MRRVEEQGRLALLLYAPADRLLALFGLGCYPGAEIAFRAYTGTAGPLAALRASIPEDQSAPGAEACHCHP